MQELPEYKDVKPKKILSTKERIMKKIPALIILLVIWGGLVYLAGARTFEQGFIYSFTIWFIIKIFVVFIIDILWYSNSPKYWIKGTEDLEKNLKTITDIMANTFSTTRKTIFKNESKKRIIKKKESIK